MTIPVLIDKQDNNEIIAAQIAAILKTESAAQVVLAIAGGQTTPKDWELAVFINRTEPFEKWLNAGDAGEEAPDFNVPIVSVWFDTDSVNSNSGDGSRVQQRNGTFNIDIYGAGKAEDVVAGGHIPADVKASTNAYRGARLVRNILMAELYRYLGLRGVVGKRSVQSRDYFKPQLGDQYVQNIIGLRISLSVSFNEFAPEAETEILELIKITMTPDNEILLPVVQDFT